MSLESIICLVAACKTVCARFSASSKHAHSSNRTSSNGLSSINNFATFAQSARITSIPDAIVNVCPIGSGARRLGGFKRSFGEGDYSARQTAGFSAACPQNLMTSNADHLVRGTPCHRTLPTTPNGADRGFFSGRICLLDPGRLHPIAPGVISNSSRTVELTVKCWVCRMARIGLARIRIFTGQLEI